MNPNSINTTEDQNRPIVTLVEFWTAFDRLPARVPLGLEKWWSGMKAAGLDPNQFAVAPDDEERASPYASWHHLRRLIEDAATRDDSEMLTLCFDIASRTLDAGETGEMWEASYVSFIEDLRLPPNRKAYERVLRLMPSTLREMWTSQSPHSRRSDDRLPRR